MAKLIILILLSATCSAMAQTNVVVVDRVETIANTITGYLTIALAAVTGIMTAITTFLVWYSRNKSKIAELVPTLMRKIEAHGSSELKEAIKDEAGELGIEPTMNAQKLANVPAKAVDKPTVTIDSLKTP
jgi:hypothetical protein